MPATTGRALWGMFLMTMPGWAPARAAGPSPFAARDPRSVHTGRPIPDENYCDQPYVVLTREGHWLCTLTTGPGREGHPGQHIVATRSTDQGRTWSRPVSIEPSDGPEASWAVPFAAPSGRIYVFDTYTGEDVHTLRGRRIRADTIGWYCYRTSDDGGRTWSERRHRLPLRVTACDRGNDWGGAVQIFWGIDKPKVVGRRVCFAFTKLGKFMLERGEGWLFCSDNLLTEEDPARVRWSLLPEGEHGIRAPEFGSVQEEHNVAALSDGSLVCVYRTTTGTPCQAISRDGGRTWTRPERMTYTPGGRPIKNPRACPRVWRTAGGRFLLWFHNHGSRSFRGRNPVWIAGGVETDGHIHWSQPEILLYDPGDVNGMSYPDLIEQDGRTWVTETQKTVARVHEVDPTLLQGLWTQGTARTVAREGLLLDIDPDDLRAAKATARPARLDLRVTGGLTLDVWLPPGRREPGEAILDGRDAEGQGVALLAAEKHAVELRVSDGAAQAAWTSDPGLLTPAECHHVVAIVEAGPRVVAFVVDGVLCDGGSKRTHGWTRYGKELGDVSGAAAWRLGRVLGGQGARLRVYGRALRVSEAASHFHAGP